MKLRFLITAAALALATCGSAHADNKPHYLYNGGSWQTYAMIANDGKTPLCGMQVTGSDKSMYVKYVNGTGKIVVQLYKSSWRFPKEGVDVPVTVGFDKNGMIEANAIGNMTDYNNPMVTFTLSGELADGFLHEFGEANQMWVKFGEGTEVPWVADMHGSRGAAGAFHVCVGELQKHFPSADSPNATQPYASKPATPPTQPFGSKPAPATKKDDGGI